MDEPCADCGKDPQVMWCPLWDVFLCVFCRANRTALNLAAGKQKWALSTGLR